MACVPGVVCGKGDLQDQVYYDSRISRVKQIVICYSTSEQNCFTCFFFSWDDLITSWQIVRARI
jgi:hypothetical protein